jgi:hypothetical protein
METAGYLEMSASTYQTTLCHNNFPNQPRYHLRHLFQHSVEDGDMNNFRNVDNADLNAVKNRRNKHWSEDSNPMASPLLLQLSPAPSTVLPFQSCTNSAHSNVGNAFVGDRHSGLSTAHQRRLEGKYDSYQRVMSSPPFVGLLCLASALVCLSWMVDVELHVGWSDKLCYASIWWGINIVNCDEKTKNHNYVKQFLLNSLMKQIRNNNDIVALWS